MGTLTWSKVFGKKENPTKTAVVEFATIDEAKWVVTNLNGNIAQGLTTPIQVSFKKPSEKKKGKALERERASRRMIWAGVASGAVKASILVDGEDGEVSAAASARARRDGDLCRNLQQSNLAAASSSHTRN